MWQVRSALGRAISGATGARCTKQPSCQTVTDNTINSLRVNEGRSAAARGGLLRAAATHCGRHLLVNRGISSSPGLGERRGSAMRNGKEQSLRSVGKGTVRARSGTGWRALGDRPCDHGDARDLLLHPDAKDNQALLTSGVRAFPR